MIPLEKVEDPKPTFPLDKAIGIIAAIETIIQIKQSIKYSLLLLLKATSKNPVSFS